MASSLSWSNGIAPRKLFEFRRREYINSLISLLVNNFRRWEILWILAETHKTLQTSKVILLQCKTAALTDLKLVQPVRFLSRDFSRDLFSYVTGWSSIIMSVIIIIITSKHPLVRTESRPCLELIQSSPVQSTLLHFTSPHFTSLRLTSFYLTEPISLLSLYFWPDFQAKVSHENELSHSPQHLCMAHFA